MRLLLVALLALGCGNGSSPAVDAALTSDGAQAGDAGAIRDGGGLPGSCEGDCQTLTLRASFGGQVRDFDRAYFGIDTSGSASTLHVEAYVGGADGCPTNASPTPDYTLVLSSLPRPATTAALTAQANLLDFSGDLLGGSLGAQATSVMVTPRAASDAMLAVDATIEFADGTVSGSLYATHCASLDG